MPHLDGLVCLWSLNSFFSSFLGASLLESTDNPLEDKVYHYDDGEEADETCDDIKDHPLSAWLLVEGSGVLWAVTGLCFDFVVILIIR